LEFVRVNRPASDILSISPFPTVDSTPRLRACGTTRSPVPSSWFLTTSTACAHWKPWVCCAPEPDRIRWISNPCRPHPKMLAITRLPNQRCSHP